MALQVTEIATSIAAYSVTGLTIRDLDDFDDEVQDRASDLPVLMPAPNYWSNLKVKHEAYGTGAIAPITVTYRVNYRFFYEEIGAERDLKNIYPGFIGMLTSIVDAIIANDATDDAVHLTPLTPGPLGSVPDPSGNTFYGCDFSIEVTEFIN